MNSEPNGHWLAEAVPVAEEALPVAHDQIELAAATHPCNFQHLWVLKLNRSFEFVLAGQGRELLFFTCFLLELEIEIH